MLWLVMGIISWVVLLITKDDRSIKKSIWAGLIAVAFQLVVDYFAVKTNLYKLDHGSVCLFGEIPLSYTFGMVFPMGVLFAYHLPLGKILQLLHITIFASLFYAAEEILHNYDYLILTNWDHVLSITVNLLVFTSMAYLTEKFDLKGGY